MRSEENHGLCGYWYSPLTTAHCPFAHLHTCTLGEEAFRPLRPNAIQGMGLFSNWSTLIPWVFALRFMM